MVGNAEAVLQRLGLPYRVVLLCAGDMGSRLGEDLRPRGLAAGAAGVPRDLLVLELRGVPGEADGDALQERAGQDGFVHTLNGSGLAVGRTLVAVLENYQQADGSVVVPDALRPYMGGLEVLKAV